MNPSERIDELIAKLTDWRGKTLASIRKGILEADREIIEEWKWMGSPVWSRDGIIAVGNAHKDKVSFTLSLWALPTAIIPSRDHTGLPIHFHSSMISRSASRMPLRILASVLPRQSVSFAISRSIFSDGFIESLCFRLTSA